MKPKNTLLAFCFLMIVNFSFATTWNEPWQEEIIKKADYFVLAKVKSFTPDTLTIVITKTLGGENITGEINITNFYLLQLCSTSGGHGPEFHFNGIEDCYFFLKKNSNNEYCISTPTSGFDFIKEGNVQATYRHSYHKTLVATDIYEKTMSAIFNHYHNQSYDVDFIKGYIEKNLSLKPAGFSKEEINTFFAQHVCLETIYHLRLSGFYPKILPFLNDPNNFHNQISAARALIGYNTSECKAELLKIIEDATFSDFSKVMCIWTLGDFKPVELKGKLIKIAETASDEDNSFGGNIMDPRICTHLPDTKSALDYLISTL